MKNFLGGLTGRNDKKKVEEAAREIPRSALVAQPKLVTWMLEQEGIHAQPIATDTFIDKSRDAYPPPWLARELIQNFVDHNQADPGTLNGVHFASEKMKSGKTRFTISGKWPFEDATGVLAPHSDKPVNFNTAGGNGIGLKQTALRLLRDFGVSTFDVQGEGWLVRYQLARAQELEAKRQNLAKTHPELRDPKQALRFDWLIGAIEQSKIMGSNAYIIETDNPVVIAALSELSTLGVSKENPFLRDSQYENPNGKIRWLPRLETGAIPRGRLFLNGQVMHYKKVDADPSRYWDGPEGLSLQLNNVKYKMSIDRPPIGAFDLGTYLDGFVSAMTKEDLLAQLKESEHLWAGNPGGGYSFEKEGFMVVLDKIATQLSWKKYDPREWKEAFSLPKYEKYIAVDSAVSAAQIEELRKDGYVVCPNFFGKLGMPTASSKLGAIEVASNRTPQLSSFQLARMAEEHGIEVDHAMYDGKDPAKFFDRLTSDIQNEIAAVEWVGSSITTLRFKLKTEVPSELLTHRLSRPATDEQRMLYSIRGIAAAGLENKLFKKIFTSQGAFVTTFGLSYDAVVKANVLIARNTPHKAGGGVFMELELSEENAKVLYDAALQKLSIRSVSTVVPEQEMPEQRPTQPAIEREAQPKQQKAGTEKEQWTPGDQNLYEIASAKAPDARTPEEDEAILKWERVKNDFKNIPVDQPEGKVGGREATPVETTLSDTDKDRITQMEKDLPGMLAMIESLEAAVPRRKIEAPTGKSAAEQYLIWRASPDFYGKLGDNANYLTGKGLFELVDADNQANIESRREVREISPAEAALQGVRRRLKEIVERMSPGEHEIDDFELITSPSERQLAQLGLLRHYAHVTTSAALPNDLFLYGGTGSKGVNIGQKAIGLHASLLDVAFTEALSTFTHEIAHNHSMDHGYEFMHAMQSLFVSMLERVSSIANKLQSGQSVTEEERAILDIQAQWDILASRKTA